MERQQYLNTVSQRSGFSLDSEPMRSLALLLPTDEEHQSQVDCLKDGFMLDPHSGHPGLVIYASLPEALKLFENPSFSIDNWHYDKTAGVVLINLRRGTHEFLSTALLALYLPSNASENQDKDAESFLHEGLGWFLSSSSFGKLMKSKNVSMSAQEKRVFSGWAKWEI